MNYLYICVNIIDLHKYFVNIKSEVSEIIFGFRKNGFFIQLQQEKNIKELKIISIKYIKLS